MTYNYTMTESRTFTITHARHLAAKVATDLKRIQRFYGVPDDKHISNLEEELVMLLRDGFLDEVSYGFKRNESWIEPTLRFTAQDLSGNTANDDDPGRIRANCNVYGAKFYSFMEYSSSWYQLSDVAKNEYSMRLPIKRGESTKPGVHGYLEHDRTYSAGGRSLKRSSVRS